MLKLHTNILLNSILVKEDIRPAFMVQTIDYGELNINEPITKSILTEIKELFPEYIYSYDQQGIIISKSYNNNPNPDDPSSLSSRDLGKILGYPCYEYNKYENEDDDTLFTISIRAITETKKIELFTNASENTYKLNEFEDIAKEANDAFKRNNDILEEKGIKIENVEVSVKKIVSMDSIITKLSKNIELDEDDYYRIKNVFYNMDFSEDFNDDFIYFDEYNPVHRGILIGILLTEKNDVLSPFYPLTDYPLHYIKVKKITAKLEKNLIKIFKKSK